jgi:hypothetical protein
MSRKPVYSVLPASLTRRRRWRCCNFHRAFRVGCVNHLGIIFGIGWPRVFEERPTVMIRGIASELVTLPRWWSMRTLGWHRRNAGLEPRSTFGDNPSIEKGRTVKGIDHSLWEHEIAEYISLHPDLEDLPPPKFPRRRSRLGRWFWLYRQARRVRRARRGRRSPAGYVLIISLLVLETLVLGAIVGWWLGWHL